MAEDRNKPANSDAWPPLPYEPFKPTAHLLHMGVQVIGKIKLMTTPFEPQWANVALFVTAQGLSTGIMPYGKGAFTIAMDFINHKVICTTSWSGSESFDLKSMSVAKFTETLFATLKKLGVSVTINLKPQEIPNPINFDRDTEQRPYDKELATAWWRILLNTTLVMQQYHAKFTGKTQPIGFMWGTFDLRDVRFNGKSIQLPPIGPNSGYLRRNAMNAAQVEVGWWSGNEMYTQPAYYAFTYPQPAGIETATIKPDSARWIELGEFILDYEDVRTAKNPAQTVLEFFESTYEVGAKLAGWDPALIGAGVPEQQ